MPSSKYWYFIVEKMLKRYKKLDAEKSDQEKIFKDAIDSAIADLMNDREAESKMKFYQMVYFDGTHQTRGASNEIHISLRTGERWRSDFVNSVGKYAGFEKVGG